MSRPCRIAFIICLILLTHAAAWSQTTDQIQTIVREGDKVGSAQLKAGFPFFIGSMNDKGQLILTAMSAVGGQLLLRYSEGRLTPIAGAEHSRAADGGPPGVMCAWPAASRRWLAGSVRELVQQPARPHHLSVSRSYPIGESPIGCDDDHAEVRLGDGGDRVVALARRMHNLNTVHVTLIGSRPGSALEYQRRPAPHRRLGSHTEVPIGTRD